MQYSVMLAWTFGFYFHHYGLFKIFSLHSVRWNLKKLLNYLYDPEVAASIAAGTGYISPVEGAAEVIAKTDPVLAANPFVFPTPELLKRAFVTMPFTPEQQADFDAAWAKLIGN